MSDDLRDTGARDDSRINLNQPHEVDYWTKELNCSREELEQAVLQVGPSVERVKEFLSSGN